MQVIDFKGNAHDITRAKTSPLFEETGAAIDAANGECPVVHVHTFACRPGVVPAPRDVEPALVDISDLIDLSNRPVQLTEAYKVTTLHGFPIIARRNAGSGFADEQVILVDRGETDYDRYVVAHYTVGQAYWYGGNYTSSFDKAVEIFQGKR